MPAGGLLNADLYTDMKSGTNPIGFLIRNGRCNKVGRWSGPKALHELVLPEMSGFI